MRKVVFAGVAILMLVLVSPAVAMDEEELHRYEAERLLVLMKMEKNLNDIIEQTLIVELQRSPQMLPYKDVFKKFFAKYMSWENLKEDFITIYAEEFTVDEIRDLIKFYESPTGKKSIEKTPILFMKGAELGQRRVEENIPELQRMIEEETARIKALQEKEMKAREEEKAAPEGEAQGE